jgi:hypothetical protein
MQSKKIIFVLATMLLVNSISSNAQIYVLAFKIPDFMKRYEIEFGYPITFAQYKRSDVFTNPITKNQENVNYTANIRSKFSYAANIGYSFPFGRIGNRGRPAIAVGFNSNFVAFDSPTPVLNQYGSYDLQESFLISSIVTQLALPIGLDLKFGCDGMTDKKYTFCSAVGAGIYPYYNISLDAGDINSTGTLGLQNGVLPYIRGEVGLFAGICMKLRGTLVLGNMTYIDGKASTFNNPNDSYNISLKGKTTATISLVFLPLSWLWKKSEWWNTY